MELDTLLKYNEVAQEVPLRGRSKKLVFKCELKQRPRGAHLLSGPLSNQASKEPA